MNNNLVVAVIVLHNNLKETKSIIKALKAQSKSVEEIICIDNSDKYYAQKNKEYLDQVGLNISYFKTKKNIGSAGGFALGMEIAHKSGAEWIWLNDQDGIPHRDCLKEMLSSTGLVSADTIIAPKIVTETEGQVQFLRQFGFFGKTVPFNKFNDIKNIEATGTAGMLINRSVVSKIGVYNNIVCFVGNEDIEYCRRALKYGTDIIYEANAQYFHPDLLKKKKKESQITLPRFIHKLIPFYFGTIDERSKIKEHECMSSSYINTVYNKKIVQKVNKIYSKFRSKLKLGNDLGFYKLTVDAYNKGEKYAKSMDVIYRITNLDDYFQ